MPFVVAIALGAGYTGSVHNPEVADGPDPRVVEVAIEDFRFAPDTLRIEPGTSVRWVNRDPVGHTSTADDGAWESPLLGPGESFVQRFDQEGTYAYHCTPHPFMRGVVVVRS